MGMGIGSDSEFDLEKSRFSNIREESNSVSETNATIVDIQKGRGNNPEVPNGLRKIIGEESEINGRQAGLDIAKQFGISPSSASAYANGSTSTASYDSQPNLNHINGAKERIAKRARTKLMKALFHITDDKLGDAKARDLAGIAKDMSAIVKDMEPEKERIPGDNGNGPTFIFYAPQFRDERSFDVVHVKE